MIDISVIAWEKIVLIRPNGKVQPLTLGLGKPFFESEDVWRCRAKMDGLNDTDPLIAGSDSWSALFFAIKFLKSRIQKEVNAGATLLRGDPGKLCTVEDLFPS